MKHSLIYLSVVVLILAACAPAPASTPTPAAEAATQTAPAPAETEATEATEAPPAETGEPAVITLMTHDSFSVSEEVLAAFEAENNARVELLPSGDAGSALNQAILSRNNPLADVFFGVDNTFMSRALEAGIFEAYASPLLDRIPDELELDAGHHLLPVDYGDVCLNYDKTWFAERDLAPPGDLSDLTGPDYQGLTVVENPATSSPGLAFLLATIGHFGEEGYLDYWAALRDNQVLVVDGWEEAYWGQFTAASDGDRPIVVSYATSPPAEVYFAQEPMDEAPTDVVLGDGACFRQVEFAGILEGARDRPLAERLIDFMLSERFQEDIPLQMFVFPANQEAELPELFVKFARVAENPAEVPPEAIEANREDWIEAWTETVLR
jgi:thiamine transport system substrate-binding protein